MVRKLAANTMREESSEKILRYAKACAVIQIGGSNTSTIDGFLSLNTKITDKLKSWNILS